MSRSRFKLLLVGDSNVGKSTLLSRFAVKDYSSLSKELSNIEVRKMEIGDNTVELEIWDIPGKHKLEDSQAKGANSIVFVYDITNRESFNHIVKWMKETEQYQSNPCQLVLVGNKSDDARNQQVDDRVAREFAKKHNMLFIETSAKENTNVDKLLQQLAEKMVDPLGQKQKRINQLEEESKKPLSNKRIKEIWQELRPFWEQEIKQLSKTKEREHLHVIKIKITQLAQKMEENNNKQWLGRDNLEGYLELIRKINEAWDPLEIKKSITKPSTYTLLGNIKKTLGLIEVKKPEVKKPPLSWFKLLLVGDSNVGKSTLLSRFTEKDYSSLSKELNISIKEMEVGDNTIKLEIWDIPGKHKLEDSQAKGADSIVFVYDITNQKSFYHLEKWMKEAERYQSDPCQLVLVGNKSDDARNQQVDDRVAREFAKKHNMLFIETSAKENTLNEFLKNLSTKMIDSYYQKQKKSQEKYMIHHNQLSKSAPSWDFSRKVDSIQPQQESSAVLRKKF